MLESWYQKLKYDIFDGKPNHCKDILIHEEIQQYKQKAKALVQKVTKIIAGRYWIVSSGSKPDINYLVEKNIEF
ncbi:30171_t:CDS:2 [Racocetra persica]|uniref:30171_t:CDS:1 n=1 Tax=Racocetra persica TaxID=160502 RepID=A0ACA9L140_9GLOM|nr:30171_t:CDS:2 [Racocetra persica]